MADLKLTKNTYSARPKDIERTWYVVDAEGLVLGRLATGVATVLRGKHKPMYTPSIDTGDHVIVINAAKVVVTGGKETKKVYYHHSGYPGGLKETPYEVMLERRPEQVIIHAVRGMLPKNRLGRAMLRKLHVYPGGEHPHAAQKPEPLEL
jgi:large subunit ribosomal protein L13